MMRLKFFIPISMMVEFWLNVWGWRLTSILRHWRQFFLRRTFCWLTTEPWLGRFFVDLIILGDVWYKHESLWVLTQGCNSFWITRTEKTTVTILKIFFQKSPQNLEMTARNALIIRRTHTYIYMHIYIYLHVHIYTVYIYICAIVLSS